MSKRTLILLAAVNAALLAFILIYERGTLSTTDTAGRSGQVLRSFVRDRVERVELVRGDDPPIVFVRERDEDADEAFELGSWTIAAPRETAADDDAVDALLSSLEWLGSHRVRERVTAEDRAQFGLDSPRFVVRFAVLDQQVELRVGGDAPTGEGIYAEVVGEDRVYVIEEDFVEAIDHDLAHFRNKELFLGFYPTGVQRIEVGDYVFGRRDAVWRVEEPVTGWANQGVVDGLTALTRQLTATRFVSDDADDLARFGLDSPWREMTITRSDQVREPHRVARLRVGDVCGEHDGERYALAGEEGPVTCVLASDLDALTFDAAQVREPRLLPISDELITQVIVTQGGRRLALRRENGGWKVFTGSPDAPGRPGIADEGSVTAWLAQLRDARAIGFEPLDETARGLDAPAATIRIERENDEPAIDLVVGEVDAVGVWIRRGDELSIAQFPLTVVDEVVRVGPLRFRGRELFEAESADASEIVVVRGAVRERAARGQGGVWSLTAPIETAADRVVVSAMARQLSALRALRFVAESAQPAHGLGDDATQVSATFTPAEGEATEVAVRIGADTEGGAFASLVGQDSVFVLGSEAVTALRRSLASLDLLTIDTAGLESLRILRGEEVIELRQVDGVWSTADGAAPDEARTRALMDRLSTLRAIGVQGYQDAVRELTLEIVATRRPTVAGDREVRLRVGSQGDADYVPMTIAGLGIVYRVRPDTIEILRTYQP